MQAQWRMCLARRSYQRVQRATLSIQRQWRETRGVPSHINATLDVVEKATSVGGLLKSDICIQANDPHELSVEKSAAATQCKELTGKFQELAEFLTRSIQVHWKERRITVREPSVWFIQDHSRKSECIGNLQ